MHGENRFSANDRAARTRHPLQVEESGFGWTVTLYGRDGHARHVVNAESEIEAFRSAHNIAHLYHVTGEALVRTSRGEYLVDIERLMHRHRH